MMIISNIAAKNTDKMSNESKNIQIFNASEFGPGKP